MKRVLLVVLMSLSPLGFAQELEEIVVTGSRIDSESPPGQFLRRNGDFLLLVVYVSNDTRDEEQRYSEMFSTLRNVIADARRAKDVEVSLISDDNLVVPLTIENHQGRLSQGGRPDTSVTTISVKTPIPSSKTDGQALINRLESFVEKVTVVGRTQLEPAGDVQITVVGPNQYRDQIIQVFADDVKTVTSALGENYRVIVEGIDSPVSWYRVGLLELALYIPYSYVVVPETVNSYFGGTDD